MSSRALPYCSWIWSRRTISLRASSRRVFRSPARQQTPTVSLDTANDERTVRLLELPDLLPVFSPLLVEVLDLGRRSFVQRRQPPILPLQLLHPFELRSHKLLLLLVLPDRLLQQRQLVL